MVKVTRPVWDSFVKRVSGRILKRFAPPAWHAEPGSVVCGDLFVKNCNLRPNSENKRGVGAM
jgi:hypothetical protein